MKLNNQGKKISPAVPINNTGLELKSPKSIAVNILKHPKANSKFCGCIIQSSFFDNYFMGALLHELIRVQILVVYEIFIHFQIKYSSYRITSKGNGNVLVCADFPEYTDNTED
jgi:hypothetical protein